MSYAGRENQSTSANIEGKLFSEGAFRYVYRGVYTNGPRKGTACVSKVFKDRKTYEEAFFRLDIKAVDKAIDIVTKFNAEQIIGKKIFVNAASVWQFHRDGEKNLVEPYIKNWEKFNSNSGWQSTSHTWDLVMHALSHYSYHASGGFLVLCDLQGGLTKQGAIISDPVILSRNSSYGVTDLGKAGIINFFTSHRCSEYCRSDWARPKQTGYYYDQVQGTTMRQLAKDAPYAPTMGDYYD